MGTLTHRFKYIVTALFVGAAFSLSAAAQQQPLDELYNELKEADEDSHAGIANRIIAQWEKSGSPAMDLLRRRGEDAMEAGDFAVAVEHFTALIDHAPDFAEGYHGRASAYYNLGLVGPALDDLRQTLVLNPRHFDALFGFAVIMEELKRPETAREIYQEILTIYPRDVDALGGLERLELQMEGRAI